MIPADLDGFLDDAVFAVDDEGAVWQRVDGQVDTQGIGQAEADVELGVHGELRGKKRALR